MLKLSGNLTVVKSTYYTLYSMKIISKTIIKINNATHNAIKITSKHNSRNEKGSQPTQTLLYDNEVI